MKFSECNAREKKAWKNIKHCADSYIFGLQLTCQDNEPSEEDYVEAYATLTNLETLESIVYGEALNAIYTQDGGVIFNKTAESYLKDIRFCGTDFLKKVTHHFCKKYQEEALAELAAM